MFFLAVLWVFLVGFVFVICFCVLSLSSSSHVRCFFIACRCVYIIATLWACKGPTFLVMCSASSYYQNVIAMIGHAHLDYISTPVPILACDWIQTVSHMTKKLRSRTRRGDQPPFEIFDKNPLTGNTWFSLCPYNSTIEVPRNCVEMIMKSHECFHFSSCEKEGWMESLWLSRDLACHFWIK